MHYGGTEGSGRPTGWIGTAGIVVSVVLAVGAILCIMGLLHKFYVYRHVNNLERNEDENNSNVDASEYRANQIEDTSGINTTNIEEVYPLNPTHSHNTSFDPSAPPDISIQGITDIHSRPPVYPARSSYSPYNIQHPPSSRTDDPPPYEEAIKL